MNDYAVLVGFSFSRGRTTLRMLEAFGPFPEEEADALAKRLAREYGLQTEAVRLRPWDESLAQTRT